MVSHPGPVIVYLAKVDNAASTGTSGLRWFKVAEAGLNNGRWAVDDLIANGGWSYFNMPTCIAPGQYLMRAEIIALHNAGSSQGAQFYIGCAQINVTGGGSTSPSSTVSFPGAYSASDPGILINIYGTGGSTNNNGKAYQIPGPQLFTCSGGGGGGSSPQPTNPSNPQPTNGGGGSGAPLYGQCGGIGWTGPTTCASGTCKASNQYYSQCLP